ncbi:MAG: HD domain-containing protein [Spirochaetaceae bacterium]|nr:HD domain-containing protein [Spirochaetaceae bacterium]MBQ7905688.1 HD domain-containing protein [Spirochaetaceae bacterium]
MPKILESVIEIGSTGIRLVVCQRTQEGVLNVVDKSELPVSLGWDVFTSRLVSRETLLQCIKILSRFKEQLAGWGIKPEQNSIIATSALREATNRDTVVDRIFVKTGFRVKIIDGIEENFYMYTAVLESLRYDYPQIKTQNSIILEIGGGSTEIMVLNKGKMAAVHSLRLGTVIIQQNIKNLHGTQQDTRHYLRDYIKNTGVNLNTEISLQKIQVFISIGSELQIAAKNIGLQLGLRCWKISREDFFKFVDKVQAYSTEECMAKYQISYNDAQSFGIGLLTYKLFLGLTSADSIIVTDTTIREGLLQSKVSSESNLQSEFTSQVVASAVNIGRKYHFDEEHAKYVCKVALKIYDALENELGLSSESRNYLEVASILHDVGTFIRGADHQKHSKYIIANSDIFGLAKDSMKIISQIALYHRGNLTQPTDDDFYAFSRQERTLVLKLASILRIADSMDRSHTQHIEDFNISFKADTMIIHTNNRAVSNLEKMAITEKSDLFEFVFGYTIIVS